MKSISISINASSYEASVPKAFTKASKGRSKKTWSSKEDNFLVYLVNNIIGCKWKFISKYFPDKTMMQVYNRYRQINPNIKRGRFTRAEDEQIIELVKINGCNWAKLAAIMQSRSAKQIRARYIFRLKARFE